MISRLTLLLLFCTALAFGEEVATFAQIAQPHPRSRGAPKASDVCFSSRWPRPNNRTDPHDSFQAARAFHATRLDWLYLSGKPDRDREFVHKFKTIGFPVGGTLNCQLPDSPTGEKRTFTIARTVNMKGEPLKDPWTQKYGGRFGCPNNPEYAKLYLTHARYALEAGVDHFQMDGVQLNVLMTKYGGCFCEHCVRSFREYLAARSTPQERAQWGIESLDTFDYARFLLERGTNPDAGIHLWKGPKALRERFQQFQLESGLRFVSRMHQEIDRMAGRKLAYSCNANEEFLTDYYKVYDFALNETYPAKEGNVAFLYNERLKPSQEKGKSFLMTFVSTDVPHNRRFISWAYALGANVIVPWDVFIGLHSPRFFGTPEQFADLFGFVRAVAPLLDGYEEAEVFGPGIRDARYDETAPPIQVCARSPVLAVIRAKPQQPDAPVVVHLAATTAAPTGPIRVTLDGRRFFGNRPLKMRFLKPARYDAAQHEAAATNGNFAPLVAATNLPSGRFSVVELPEIDPWGILVVEPDKSKDNAPWQPAVWCAEKSRFSDVLQVRLTCATAGAQIRYTLDGSQPTPTSPLYENPIQISTPTTVIAQAITRNGWVSAPSRVSFTRLAPRPRLAPDAPSLKSHLKLWLRADSLAATLSDGAPVRAWQAIIGPSATVPASSLLDGEKADSPQFNRTALNGFPGLKFDGVNDQLSIRGFANAALAGKPFTVFLVTQSADTFFGVCGNGINGGGGIPRLYLTRRSFGYGDVPDAVPVGAAPGQPAITVYQHDGKHTASTRSNGQRVGQRDDLPVVTAFGAGGHFSIPFWSGNANRAGVIGEIIVYDRFLTETEMQGIEEELAVRYAISEQPFWY